MSEIKVPFLSRFPWIRKEAEKSFNLIKRGRKYLIYNMYLFILVIVSI